MMRWKPLLAPVLMGLTLGLMFAALPVALVAGGRAMPGDIALVIAPPWAGPQGAGGIVAAAGGQQIGPAQAPFAVLAVLQQPDAALRLGAWAVLDGRRLAALCGVSLNELSGGIDHG